MWKALVCGLSLVLIVCIVPSKEQYDEYALAVAVIQTNDGGEPRGDGGGERGKAKEHATDAAAAAVGSCHECRLLSDAAVVGVTLWPRVAVYVLANLTSLFMLMYTLLVHLFAFYTSMFADEADLAYHLLDTFAIIFGIGGALASKESREGLG